MLHCHFNYEVLLVLSFTCVVLLVLSGPGGLLALLLRLVRAGSSASCRSFVLNERNHNR